jgi:hypothetical protein
VVSHLPFERFETDMKKLSTTILALAALTLWLAALPAHAQGETLKTESDVQKFTVRVMSAVGRGELDAAYTALKNYSVLPAAEIDAGLQQSQAQRAQPIFAARYGRTDGYDLIGKRKLGNSMLRFAYIEKTERQPLPWVFHFYQTSRGWALSEFGWDANAAALYLAE